MWPPEDGNPYMPANGTEGEMFIESWCAGCALDDEENEDYCEILSNSFFGVQPKEWKWRNGKPVCTAYREDADNPPRCPLTMEMF